MPITIPVDETDPIIVDGDGNDVTEPVYGFHGDNSKEETYSKDIINTNFYKKTDVYTKTEVDTNFYKKTDVYTKTEADTNYYNKTNTYTKEEVNQREATLISDAFLIIEKSKNNVTQEVGSGVVTITQSDFPSGKYIHEYFPVMVFQERSDEPNVWRAINCNVVVQQMSSDFWNEYYPTMVVNTNSTTGHMESVVLTAAHASETSKNYRWKVLFINKNFANISVA